MTHTTGIYRKTLKRRRTHVDILGEYVDSYTHIPHVCHKCSYIWEDTPSSVIQNNTNNYTACPRCRKMVKYNKKYRKINLHIKIIPMYLGVENTFLYKCGKCCHEWASTHDDILSRNSWCIKCRESKHNLISCAIGNRRMSKRTLRKFEKFSDNKLIRLSKLRDIKKQKSAKKLQQDYLVKLKSKHPTIECVGKYTHSLVKVLHKCHICNHEWYPFPNNLIQGHGCPRIAAHARLS